MRLFVAAYPDQHAVADLQKLVSGLAVAQPAAPGRSTRLQPPERWHVTLAFIGDVPDGKEVKAAKAIERSWEGQPSRLRIAGGGSFGRGKFTVLWAGIRGDLEGLGGLATAVRRELKRDRLPFDPRPYQPHLTVARPGDRLAADLLAADRAALDAYQGPLWTLDEVHLVRSYLGPTPVYETLAVAKSHSAPVEPR